MKTLILALMTVGTLTSAVSAETYFDFSTGTTLTQSDVNEIRKNDLKQQWNDDIYPQYQASNPLFKNTFFNDVKFKTHTVQTPIHGVKPLPTAPRG